MTLIDLKMCLQKNLNITGLHDTFNQVWNNLLIDHEKTAMQNVAGTYYDNIPNFIIFTMLYDT